MEEEFLTRLINADDDFEDTNWDDDEDTNKDDDETSTDDDDVAVDDDDDTPDTPKEEEE